MAGESASLERSNSENQKVQEGLSFSAVLKYKDFEQGQQEECDQCPEGDGNMEVVFDHYLNHHCDDVPHVVYFKAVWRALMALRSTTRQYQSRHHFIPPALKAANLDFIKEMGTVYPTMKQPPVDTTEQINPGPQEDHGISASTDAVRGKLESLDDILRKLSSKATGKEEEILETIGDYVDLTQASKESEHYVINGTMGARGWGRPRVKVATERGMAGARDIREANVDGTFYSIRHGQVVHCNETHHASLIALDLTIHSPKNSSIDYAIIEITYKDNPWGSQRDLQAHQWFEPKEMSGLKNGCLITKNYTVSPEFTYNGVAVKVGSLADSKQFNQDDNCWKIQGTTKNVKNLRRQHRWVIDGDDTRKFTVPGHIRLVVVVLHELKPFNMEIRIRGRLRGFWTNAYRYLAQLVPYHADQFLVEPNECDDLLKEKDIEDLALEKNKDYILEQPVKKLTEAMREWQEKQKELQDICDRCSSDSKNRA